MTRCDGCGCELDANLDIILQERVTLPGAETHYITRDFCSASCLQDLHEQASKGRKNRGNGIVTVNPPNWQLYK